MAATAMRIGFMGFGEAAQLFAHDLCAAGVKEMAAYSPSLARGEARDEVAARAAAAGVELVASPRALARRSELIWSLVPGREALPALRSIRRDLGSNHIYVDASTAAVKHMERAAQLLGGRSHFVDAAIMAPVPLARLKVPIILSGARADAVRDAVAPCGMNVRVIGTEPGAASAMKLIQSVCMKGIAAVLLEALEAAQRKGVLDVVADGIAAQIDERPFAQVIKRYVCGTAVHAERRIHEMDESLGLLRDLGSSRSMTRATRSKIAGIAAMKLREQFGGREPDEIGAVLRAIVHADRS